MDTTPEARDRRLAEELARLREAHPALPGRWSLEDVRLILGVAAGVEPGLAHWLEEIALRIADQIADGEPDAQREEELLAMFNRAAADVTDEDRGRPVSPAAPGSGGQASSDGSDLRTLLGRVTPENGHGEHLRGEPVGREWLATQAGVDTEPDETLRAVAIRIGDEGLTALLADGREVHPSLTWFPALVAATPELRRRWLWIGGTGSGTGVEWPELDEQISIYSIARPERTTPARRSRAPRWVE